MKNTHDPLLHHQLIDTGQHAFLDALHTRKIISVFHELRLVLYLGIMLFTGGVGYLVYQNIGSMGHVAMMGLLAVGILFCFKYIGRMAPPYSNLKTDSSHVYFDYLVLLAALLVIGLFTYIIVYFELMSIVGYGSFLSAIVLSYMAYRYDNVAALSMGITALAAALGIGISPVDWAAGNFGDGARLYVTAMMLGAGLYGVGELSVLRTIKSHFGFTYQNFGILVYFIGNISAIFVSNYEVVYALLAVLVAAFLALKTWREKAFLFFLYASIAGYIAATYLLIKLLDVVSAHFEFILFYYFPVTCIGFIVFLINKKSHFAND